MMQINRNNYEAYLLDYLEGSLDEKGRGELVLFFRQNPDLQVDLDDYESMPLMPNQNLVYDQKHLLKKIELQQFGPIHQENYEEWILAFLEGALSQTEQKQFHGFLKLNPVVQQELAAFKNTFLVPDQTIKYPAKEGLRKKVPFYYRKAIFWSSAVAAVLIVLFGILILLKNESQISTDRYKITAEQSKNTLDNPSEGKTTQDTVLNQIPATETLSPSTKTVLPENDRPLIAEADELTPDLKPDDNSGITEAKVFAATNIEKLEGVAFSGQFRAGNTGAVQIPMRDEMSTAFEYLALRDALKEEREKQQKEKSTLGKVFASLGNKIFGSSTDESGSLLSDITNRSKESFSEFADAMPVYRESDESGRTNTYLALSENLKLRISKNKHKPEDDNSKGMD